MLNLYHEIKKYFIFITCAIIVSAGTCFYIIFQHAVNENNQSENSRFNETISSIIYPSLAISDTTEISRILELAATKGRYVSIVDNDGNILAPDYKTLKNVKTILGDKNPKNCADFQSSSVSCLPIFSHEDNARFLGLSLSFSHYKLPLTIKKTMVYFAVLLFLVTTVLLYILKRMTSRLTTELDLSYEKTANLKRDAALYQLAQQVAHDIQSPIAALRILLFNKEFVSDKKDELIKGALNRICDISDDMLEKNKKTDGDNAIPFPALSNMIQSLIEEKKIQHTEKSIEIEFDCCESGDNAIAISVDPTELSRVFSNLMNNAIEACENTCARIRIILTKTYKQIQSK